jgi:hypothetical protein
MNCSANDIVDAIITAAVRRGSDGRGKDGLDGRMFMLARTDRGSFGNLLVAALRLKMKAKPERWAACKEFMTEQEAKAELRELGLPEELLKYLPEYDPENPPAELSKDAQPNGTRELMEATINAAIRHGSDRHGKDGLLGYMLVLQRTKFKTFVRLMELAQQWQVKETAQSDKPQMSSEETEARMRACGMDYDAVHAILEKRAEGGPLDYDEDPDPWGMKRPKTIDVSPDDTETGAK